MKSPASAPLPTEASTRRLNSSRLGWLLGLAALAIYLAGFFLQR
jgi:hypothetical protein